jgi:hypothetical protein
MSPTEFTEETEAPHGYVPVKYVETTGTPARIIVTAGKVVSVTGTFADNGHFLATRVTTVSSPPSPASLSGPYHISTWAADSAYGEGRTASAADVRKLVTYAIGDGKALADCHDGSRSCKAVFYLDPNHVWNSNFSRCIFYPDKYVMNEASETWFIHDRGYKDSAHRVYGKDATGCVVWEMNPKSTSVQDWWRTYLRGHADTYDAYLIDDDMMDVVDAGYFFHSGGGCLPWPTYCHSTEEIPDDADEVLARVAFVNAMTHENGSSMQFFYQQASFKDALDISALEATSHFVGLSCEGCVSSTGLPTRTNLFAGVLNEMAAVNKTNDSYLLISKGSSPEGSATQLLQRMVTTGVVWLGYEEGRTIVRPNLESDTNRLAIWPEDLIYPSKPLQSMFSGAADLAVSSDVYRREFAACYNKGRLFGHCAVVVNARSGAVTIRQSWLRQVYHHAVTVTGGDELSGGMADLSGNAFIADETTVRAGAALLLAP